jgi:hypothetical protein
MFERTRLHDKQRGRMLDENENKYKTNVEEVLGERKDQISNEWFDEECCQKLDKRNKARLKMLQQVTSATKEEYQMKRRVANTICEGKKRKWENEKLSQIQMELKECRNRSTIKR